MVARDGFPQWLPAMVSRKFPRWLPAMMVSRNSSRDGCPAMVPVMAVCNGSRNGCLQWFLQSYYLT